MNIVHVVQHLQPGGIETMAISMQHAALADEKIHIVSLEGNKKQTLDSWQILKTLDESTLHFMEKQPGWDLKCLWRLRGLLRDLQADVVHTHHIGPLIYGGISARLAGISCRVHTEHDAWHLQDKKRCRLQSYVMRLTKSILVADAKLVEQACRNALPHINTAMIYNGVDVNKFSIGNKYTVRQKLGLPKDKIIIGCVGRVEPVKGHRYLLQALPALPENVILVIAGGGSELESLQHLSNKLAIDERVIFLGHVDNTVYIYQAIDIFCQPSLNEGMPLSPLEAQACGVPAVITDVGASREALCMNTGKLVKSEDSQALSDAISSLLEEPSVVSPRDYIVSQRNFDDTMQAYRQIYQGVY